MCREWRGKIVKEGFQTERISGGVVFSANQFGSKLVKTIKRFVCQSGTAHHANGVAAMFVGDRVQFYCNAADGFIPGCGDQLATLFVPDERRANSLLVIYKRMSETTLNAKKLSVEPVDVAVTRDDTHQLATAGTK